MRARPRHAMRGALACAAVALAGCAGTQRWPWVFTQRWPPPMEAMVDPLPPGDVPPPGTEEVTIIRHADPARVRPAGMASSYPLRYFLKAARITAGSSVLTGPGGRLEILWPTGNSIVMSGECVGVIGSPSRGEAAYLMRQVDRVAVDFKVRDQVELMGGAILRVHSGPFIVEAHGPNILRVKNQSPSMGEVAYREAVFTLDPGTVVDLPLGSESGRPTVRDEGLASRRGPGFTIRYSGDMSVTTQDTTATVVAADDGSVYALGVTVRLARGERVEVAGLEPARAGAPTTAAPVEPAQPTDEALPLTPDETEVAPRRARPRPVPPPPPGDEKPPQDDGTPPQDDGTPPPDDGTPPPDDGTPPPEDDTPPQGDGASPEDGAPSPHDGVPRRGNEQN